MFPLYVLFRDIEFKYRIKLYLNYNKSSSFELLSKFRLIFSFEVFVLESVIPSEILEYSKGQIKINNNSIDFLVKHELENMEISLVKEISQSELYGYMIYFDIITRDKYILLNNSNILSRDYIYMDQHNINTNEKFNLYFQVDDFNICSLNCQFNRKIDKIIKKSENEINDFVYNKKY